jgi:hypothetical protein
VVLPFAFGRPSLNTGLRRRIAKVRARALEGLILEQLVPRDGMVEVPAGLAGNGELGTDRIPIVTVVHDEGPRTRTRTRRFGTTGRHERSLR